MHNRNYCCYRHFKQGKGKHDLSCTHCYSHVPLGVINPVPASPIKESKQANPALQIRSKPFRIQKRTHDYNQVQNKQSLPKRLREPRVYVEKIVNRFDKNELVLPIKLSGNNQYELAVRFFKKVGHSLTNQTKQQLYRLIRNFASEAGIRYSKQQNLFLNKNQFIELIMKNFNKFTYQQAQIFWEITYNQMRFKDKISADAFVYNFGKFYLDLQSYNNTFSEAALRQRVIDLRVLLFDWFNNWICLKYNIKTMKQDIQSILKQLRYGEQQLCCEFNLNYEKCKSSEVKLRLMAQTFFALTDNKFLSSQKIKTQMQKKIQQKAQKISTSRRLIKNFFETQDYSQSQKFAVTDIIQFCKQQGCDQKTMAIIISWIQGLFDYIYFNREIKQDDKQNNQLGLSLNFQSRRLQCNNILYINAQIVRQYDKFLENLFDEQVQILKNLTAIVREVFQKIPKLDGPKKQIVQCNYMAEALLRFVRGIDLSAFWHLCQIISKYKNGYNASQMTQILKQKPNQQQIKKNMKGLFTLPTQQIAKQDDIGSLHIEEASVLSKKDKVFLSIKKYNDIKQQKLVLKAKPDPKKHKTQEKDCFFQQKFDFQNETIINKQKNPIQSNFLVNINVTNEIKDTKKKDPCKNKDQIGLCSQQHLYCNCKNKYIFQASKQVNDTISTIQSLQSRIFSLLNFDC